MVHKFSEPHMGQVIKALRQQAKLTQCKLAERLNVTQAYVSQVESGAPETRNMKLDTISSIASVFSLRASDLISILESWQEAQAA